MTLPEWFDYDRWANRCWYHSLTANGRDQEWQIFRHLLSAQKVWLLRTLGEQPTQMPVIEDAAAELEDLHDRWHTTLFANRHNPVVHYHRLNGDPGVLAFDHIAQHVINHGSYHRGEIRGLYLARGCDDFPETDLILFLATDH